MKNRKPNRMRAYDYSRDNLYFVSCCVHKRRCYLGEIIQGQMHLNKNGIIAQNQWFWLGTQFPYVHLHAFVVMPNHIHGIIEINRDLIGNFNVDIWDGTRNDGEYRDVCWGDVGTDRGGDVGTGRDLSLPHPPPQPQSHPQPPKLPPASQYGNNDFRAIKIKSLSQIVGAYKTTTSKQIHLMGFMDFRWQRSFHDHIIRSIEAYERISRYIINNPKMWKDDFFNSIG